LCGIPNRLAVEGEQLVVHRFFTHSVGLASPAELRASTENKAKGSDRGLWARLKNWLNPVDESQAPAVCIPPGARLVLRDIPLALQQELGLGEEEEVTFIQLSVEAYTHRDGVRFRNGREINLQRLQQDQSVDVLCLAPKEDHEHQEAATAPLYERVG
jgi:hypothetical protein